MRLMRRLTSADRGCGADREDAIGLDLAARRLPASARNQKCLNVTERLRSSYAEMVSEASNRTVEEHELAHSRLGAKMSPPPTRLDRRNPNDVAGNVCRQASKCARTHTTLAAGMGKRDHTIPWHRHRLVAQGKRLRAANSSIRFTSGI